MNEWEIIESEMKYDDENAQKVRNKSATVEFDIEESKFNKLVT